MANNSTQVLINPDGYALLSNNNSVTSMWLDKRSAPSVALSFVLSGVNAPTGNVHVETSNAPEQYVGFGPVGTPSPADLATYPNSTVAISAVGATRWEITTAARWVRVVYVSSGNVAGLTVNCWANAPFSSP